MAGFGRGHPAELTRSLGLSGQSMDSFSEHEVRPYGPSLSPESRPKVRTSQTTGDAQEASAFAFSCSNSCWLMAPLSSRLFADAIWSAGLLPCVATDLMYWSVAAWALRAAAIWRSAMPLPRAIK
jgi:hypothetical protein